MKSWEKKSCCFVTKQVQQKKNFPVFLFPRKFLSPLFFVDGRCFVSSFKQALLVRTASPRANCKKRRNNSTILPAETTRKRKKHYRTDAEIYLAFRDVIFVFLPAADLPPPSLRASFLGTKLSRRLERLMLLSLPVPTHPGKFSGKRLHTHSQDGAVERHFCLMCAFLHPLPPPLSLPLPPPPPPLPPPPLPAPPPPIPLLMCRPHPPPPSFSYLHFLPLLLLLSSPRGILLSPSFFLKSMKRRKDRFGTCEP